jgi:predicted amidophosphoribosyltransferase
VNSPIKRNIKRTAKQTKILGVKICEFVNQHPTYSSANAVIATPSSSGRDYDVPSELANHIATSLKVDNLSPIIQKNRKTKPMKDCKTNEEKLENVRNAYSISQNTKLKRRDIILIDDIYQTGFTMNEVGRVLFEAGASSVLGLVATKTIKDL